MKKILWTIVIVTLIAGGIYLYFHLQKPAPARHAPAKASTEMTTPQPLTNEQSDDMTTSSNEDNAPTVANIHDVRLELPAPRTDNAHPQAIIVDVMVGDEVNYTSYYDPHTYAAMWVAYSITAKDMGDIKRPSKWSYNPEIDTEAQVNLCSRSYNDGYSRGHLIPNASRNGNAERQEQTFYVTNSVPQIQNGFNGGIWQRLEAAVQDIAETETIYVTTGVAFNKCGQTMDIAYTTAKMDDKQVPIPNYFYKVVLKVDSDDSGNVTDAHAIGFWFEHRSYTDKFMEYAVSVDTIEAWTGFDFFASLSNDIEALAEANSSWESFMQF